MAPRGPVAAPAASPTRPTSTPKRQPSTTELEGAFEAQLGDVRSLRSGASETEAAFAASLQEREREKGVLSGQVDQMVSSRDAADKKRGFMSWLKSSAYDFFTAHGRGHATWTREKSAATAGEEQLASERVNVMREEAKGARIAKGIEEVRDDAVENLDGLSREKRTLDLRHFAKQSATRWRAQQSKRSSRTTVA